MESIWQDYQSKGLQVLTVDIYNGPAFSVQGFIDATGATHPVLRMGGPLRISYQMGVDNYAIIDANGIVRYMSTIDGWGGFNDAQLRATIDEWLGTTSVEEATWSKVKELFWK